mgnify:CR=1 FL=1
MKKNDITVLLLLFNTSRHLLKNLSSYKKFNVVILDQSNDNKIKKDVLKILPNIKYYKITHINKGFAYGINFLTNKVKTKFFLCTQADVKISYKDILKLKLPFVKNKDAVISVPHIRSFNNFSSRQKKNKKIFKVDKIIGAIFLAEKKKFHLIKKFDENFFFYWEDIDLSKRVEMSKYSLYLNYKRVSDHNGKYFINNKPRNGNPNLTSDYAYVHFRFARKIALDNSTVFILGDINGGEINKDFKMAYKDSLEHYEAHILLKQGVYNYAYASKKIGNQFLSWEETDGSHYQAQNTYTILLYFKGFNDEVEKLIGVKRFNFL